MVHLWVRAEIRPNETRVGITPDGVAQLRGKGFQITVEDSATRVIPIEGYAKAGAAIVPEGSWPEAPEDAFIFGLKDLPESEVPLHHRHIMFGHAYKGQQAGARLLRRLRDGGGALLDLEYLTDESGHRLAAFGYWAGYAGAAVALQCWVAQLRGGICPAVHAYPDREALTAELRARMDATGLPRPRAIVIGSLGRVGRGASDLMTEMGVPVTRWDRAETAHGGPFPEVLMHDIFINAILATPGAPVFVPETAAGTARALTVIGDVACDPGSDFSPIKVCDRTTTWEKPALRVVNDPVLDVVAIDNLPSMLPRESSLDYADQLLPVLANLSEPLSGPWARVEALFHDHARKLPT